MRTVKTKMSKNLQSESKLVNTGTTTGKVIRTMRSLMRMRVLDKMHRLPLDGESLRRREKAKETMRMCQRSRRALIRRRLIRCQQTRRRGGRT